MTYCPDGRIVSGGMDSKLWMWPAGGTRGMQAEAHFGPISQVGGWECGTVGPWDRGQLGGWAGGRVADGRAA